MGDPKMYFLLSGLLQYRRDRKAPQKVTPGMWLCESFLWITGWVSHGSTNALAESNLLCLNARKFQTLAKQFKKAQFLPAQYAAEFVDDMNTAYDEDQSGLTELHDDQRVNVNEIVDRIDPEELSHARRRSSPNRSFW